MSRHLSLMVVLLSLMPAIATAQVGVKLDGSRLTWQSGPRVLGSSDQWLQVRDLAAGDTLTTLSVTGNAARFTGTGEGLRLAGQWQPRGFAQELTLTVTADPAKDRAVILRVALPLEAVGWSWWDDMGTSRTVEAGKHYERVTRWGGLRDVSAYPCSAVGNGQLGLSAAVPLHEPQVFRLAYDATRQSLEAEFDLGLSPETKKFPCQSTIRLLLYNHDPAWGFRSAVQRYYELFPEYAVRRAGAGGIWLIGLQPQTMASPWDWGFRFEEHGLEHAGYNDAHDTLTFVYTECWGIYEGMGNNPPPDGKDRYGRNVYTMKPEEMKQFVTDKLKAPQGGKFWGLPRSEVAMAEVNSAIEDAAGQWIWSHYTQTWSPKNFLSNICLNPDPDLPHPSRASVTWDGEITPAYQKAKNGGGTLSGVYLDSVCGYVGFYDENFRRDHWQYADTPLVASYKAKQPVQLHCFSCFEISKQIAERMRAEGKFMIGNTGPPEMMYWIPLLDMIGAGEANQCGMSNEAHYRYLRFCAYRKPISWMQYGFVDPKRTWEEKERGMHRSLFYAVHPGTARFNDPGQYEPSRPLYRYYEPLVQWVDEAGWQPVTLAQSSDPEVLAERYGPGTAKLADVTFIALRNRAKEARSPQITLQAAALPRSASGAVAWALVNDREATVAQTKIGCTISGVSLAADTTEVLAVGRRDAVARLFLDQGREWLDRLAREGQWLSGSNATQIVANCDFEGALASWGIAAPPSNMKDAIAELEETQPLTGKCSVLVQSQSETSVHGLNQSVGLDPNDEYILRFKYSWTRPEGAKGTMVPRFGVKGPDGEWATDKYVYFKDIQPTGGATASFERRFTIPAGCTTGFFQFMFGGHWGTVRLDDVQITSLKLEALRDRMESLPVEAQAAEGALRTSLQKTNAAGLLALASRQEAVYAALTEKIGELPEGHLKRCFTLPTRNFAESLGRATEVLTGVSVAFPAGAPFAGGTLSGSTNVSCGISTRQPLTAVQVAREQVAAPAGVALVSGQTRFFPVTVAMPAEAPWGWHDAMIVTRFKLGNQAVWLPRRVTLRTHSPLEVGAIGHAGAAGPTLSMTLKSWLPQPQTATLSVTGKFGSTEVSLPSQQISLELGKRITLSSPLPATVAAQVDAMAAAGQKTQLHWKVSPQGGTPLEGEVEAEFRRGFRCGKLTAAPALDGQFSPAEWEGAAKLSGFVKHDSAKPASRATDVYVGHSADKLYLAYLCRGQSQPRAAERQRDGAVWEDDCAEIFVQPPGTETYYHLAVNAAGSRFDARCPGSDASWNPQWEAKAGRIADGWVVEVAVPWASLGAVAGGAWRVNFGREDAETKSATCWSPTFGGFHVPSRFGDMTF
ncbi:MAG: carbohydrate-binding family 9-like protein [Armatimonadota bacterium]